MTNRNPWSHKFADALKLIDDSTGSDAWNADLAYKQIRTWLFESLEPAQREVYDFVKALQAPTTTADIVDAFCLNSNHASTLLKSLFDLKLLTRKQIRGHSGSYYIYQVPIRKR